MQLRPRHPLPFCLLLGLLSICLRAEGDWSALLLREVLETRGRLGDSGQKKESAEAPTEGLILRSYQLRHLRLAESQRGKNALQLLTRLLPAGSTLKVDAPSNTIHLLASVSAQSAAWDFLSTLDIPSENTQVGAQDLSPTLQNVLQKLEAAQSGNARLAEAMTRIEAELQKEAKLQAQEKERTKHWPYALAGVCLCGGLVLWIHRRQTKRDTPFALEQGAKSLSLAPHELLGGSFQQHQQQRELQQEMLGAINAAAIRMELLYNEQKSHREQISKTIGDQENALRLVQSSFAQAKDQLLNENQALLEKAGTRFEASADKLDQNVKQLGRQQERVEALADELQNTVQELDLTKDEIVRLQSLLEKRGDELDKARGRLSRREGELTHQQAKLAALTLLLEEGQWPGETTETADEAKTETQERPQPHPEPEEVLQPLIDQSNTITEPRNPVPCKASPAPMSFQFLPPDSPEL